MSLPARRHVLRGRPTFDSTTSVDVELAEDTLPFLDVAGDDRTTCQTPNSVGGGMVDTYFQRPENSLKPMVPLRSASNMFLRRASR